MKFGAPGSRSEPLSCTVDLRDPDAGDRLAQLELDHEHTVRATCREWRDRLPQHPTSWHDGLVDPDQLCHSLFGVADRAGWPRTVRGIPVLSRCLKPPGRGPFPELPTFTEDHTTLPRYSSSFSLIPCRVCTFLP